MENLYISRFFFLTFSSDRSLLPVCKVKLSVDTAPVSRKQCVLERRKFLFLTRSVMRSKKRILLCGSW